MFCDKQIPHNKMIYILEDIDCLDDIVKARDDGYCEEDKKAKKKGEKKEKKACEAFSAFIVICCVWRNSLLRLFWSVEVWVDCWIPPSNKNAPVTNVLRLFVLFQEV